MGDDSQFIAIIGLSCRFPGAPDPATFWANLATGTESLTPLPAGDEFDAEFFGYSDGEALLLDPQQRVFLETCWAALEDAGHDPARFLDTIGVYAGCSETTYGMALREHRDQLALTSDRQIRLATGINFLTSRVAYKLGLRGPAVTIMDACATSLVAVHTASDALLAGECGMALAGGVTVHLWRPTEPDDEGLISSDGHCRAFDAKATGTVFTDGVGVVVLRRLADALRDGNTIRAVIRGSAVDNDGGKKAGFLAPSIDGQARVIREAQLIADVGPESIGYIEAHGTGTPLGDPIEIAALTKAFRVGTNRIGDCPIGTVKTNIGHTDAAAGAAGLIKTVLALEHGLLPPSINFDAPNPEIDFDTSPFFVVTKPRPWLAAGQPRRAGVSAFGLGGTNAHVVIEEPPSVGSIPMDSTRSWRLIVQSARNLSALDTASAQLVDYLRNQPDVDLADVEWTLQAGRRAHNYRRCIVGDNRAAVIDALSHPVDADQAVESRPVVFAFPGLGGQHSGMVRELYGQEAEFRTWIDRCAELAIPLVGADLREVMFAKDPPHEGLADTGLSQPAVFMTEYAMARQLLVWGIQPDLVVGHSLGAYAAACVAGVFTPTDALKLVVMRGGLLREIPVGAMLAIPLSEHDVLPLLFRDLAVTVVNSPAQCVVAGAPESIEELRVRLADTGIDTRVLQVPVPAHSHYVAPIVDRFADIVRAVPRQAPTLPVLSELTGTVLSDDEITDPAYWAGHLRHTVRFTDALDTIFQRPNSVIFEVGPGQALTTVLRRYPNRPAGIVPLPTMPHRHDGTPESAALLAAIGRFWTVGGTVDWPALHDHQPRYRVPLPTYPFQRKRFRVDSDNAGVSTPDPIPVLTSLGKVEVDATQDRVADAFRQVLGVAHVDSGDSFFALGGDSIIAAQLVRVVRQLFGLPIPLRGVFQHPSVAGFATYIDELKQQTSNNESAG